MLVKKIGTEEEFQEVVDWWDYQRKARIRQRWGHMDWTQDMMFPLPKQYAKRRDESEAKLRPCWENGEIWICIGKDGKIHNVCGFEFRPEEPDLVVEFRSLKDLDFVFTPPPDVDPSKIPPPIEEDKWEGAPKEDFYQRLGWEDPWAKSVQKVVFESLISRGFKRLEYENVGTRFSVREGTIGRRPTVFDKRVRRQMYKVLVDLPVHYKAMMENPKVQDALKRAEEL